MRVSTETYEYTLYVGADGTWTMHAFDPHAPEGEQWRETYDDVSAADPFASDVYYDAWR